MHEKEGRLIFMGQHVKRKKESGYARLLAALFLICAGLHSQAFADTFTWTGAADSLWSNASNWSGGTGYPDNNADDVIFNDNTISQTIVFTENITINDVTWNNDQNQGFDLDGFDWTVEGSFTMATDTRLKMTKSNGQLAIDGDFSIGTDCTVTVYDIGMSSGTLSLGARTKMTIPNPSTKVALSLNDIELGGRCQLIFSMNSNMTIASLVFTGFDIVEFPRGKTTEFTDVINWDESDCTVYNTIRSFVPGTQARLRFLGGASSGDWNVYEDIRIMTNSGGNTFTADNHSDIGNNQSISGTTAGATTCEFDGNGNNTGNWSDATEWDCGCVPRSIDGVTIGAGKTVDIDELIVQCADLTFASNTSRIDGGSGRLLEVYGTLEMVSTDNMVEFLGLTEMRTHSTSEQDTIVCIGCDTAKFYGQLKFEFPGASWVLEDALVVNDENNATRGDLFVTRGTLVLNGNDVFVENDINVGSTGAVTVTTENVTIMGDRDARITINGSFDFYNLIIDRTDIGDEIEIRTPVTVTNNLDLSNIGLIYYQNTTGDTLILTDGATVTGGSNNSHVNPSMLKIGNDDFTFPVGDGTFHRPIGVTDMAGNSTATDRLFAVYIPDNPFDNGMVWTKWENTINNVNTREYWEIDALQGTPTPKITLSWQDASLSGGVANVSELTVAHWTGAIFEDLGNASFTGNSTEGTVTSTDNTSSFSPFVLASNSSNNPLPITLLSFSATAEEDHNALQWVTATESNTSHFEVYRTQSNSADQFELLGTVEAAGESREIRNYRFNDHEWSANAHYFIQSVDYDGFTQKSQVEYLSRDRDAVFTLYPNPNAGSFRVLGLSPGAQAQIFNASGVMVWQHPAAEQNEGELQIDADLPAGSYFLKVEEVVTRFVVTRP